MVRSYKVMFSLPCILTILMYFISFDGKFLYLVLVLCLLVDDISFFVLMVRHDNC
jgi:hypothetical protein